MKKLMWFLFYAMFLCLFGVINCDFSLVPSVDIQPEEPDVSEECYSVVYKIPITGNAITQQFFCKKGFGSF